MSEGKLGSPETADAGQVPEGLGAFAKANAFVFVVSFAVALLCIPGILLEREPGWREIPFNAIQFFAAFTCFPASSVFLFMRMRQGRAGWNNGGLVRIAWVATILTGLFGVICGAVILLLSLGPEDPF